MLLADLFKSRSRLEAENLFLRVVKNGRVSRIDVAVDLPGVRMDQFLFLAHQGATNRQFATNGHLETFYFATSKGNQTRIYSKKKEQLAKGKSFGKSVVRVERTLRNFNMTIAELHQLKDPFAKMVLTVQTPEPPQGEKPKVLSMFEDSIQVRGLTAALALLPEQRRSKYRKYLKKKSRPWWVPETIWAKWPAVLELLK